MKGPPPGDGKAPADPPITSAQDVLRSIFGENVLLPEDDRPITAEAPAPADDEADDGDPTDDDGPAPGEAF